MGDAIDNDVLISLVEARPVLWDKSLENFKDRNLTRDAWREVCCALKNGFDDLEDNEKNAFGREVTKRWGNLRDAFSKSKRKLKECKKSGAGAPNIKKYVYADQMQFLNKLFEKATTVEESLEVTGTDNNEDEDMDKSLEAARSPKSTICENPKQRGYKRRRQPDEVELRMIKALEEPPQPQSPQMSFFQGLMPHLNKYDDSEFLEFQMGVLEVISRINNKRKNTAQPQFFPQQTTSYYPNNFTHFPNYPLQPQQLQTHPYPNPQNQKLKNPTNSSTDSNHQQAHSSKGQHLELQQTTVQYYQNFGNTSSVRSPEPYPSASPSPSASVYSESTYDFS